MADIPSPPNPSEEFSKIAEEHAHLRNTLEQLERATRLDDLIPLLDHLKGELEQHFDEEEGEDGLARAVGNGNPTQLTILERLFLEHRQFLHKTEELARRARELLEGPKQAILGETAQLVQDLRSHEVAETALLTEALDTDIGGGD